MFKIGDGDLAPSSTSPGSSSASDASGRGVVCPSQSSSGRVELLTKLAASSSSSDRDGTGGRAGVAAPGPPAPALPLGHILHHVQEALVEHSHVSQSDEEGLGWIILWLYAVCRVVLSEVKHAACKNSRISWALRMDSEWHYNMDTTGIPAEHTQSVFQLECEWRCETESTKLFAILAYRAIRRTFAGLDAHGSPTNFWNRLPAKHRKKWEANIILASVSRIPTCDFVLLACIHTGLDHSSLHISFRFRTYAAKKPAI